MHKTIRATCHLALGAASLMISSCVVQPYPYDQAAIDDTGYYEEQSVPVGGYYGPARPRPFGVVAPGYRPAPAYRSAPRTVGVVRPGPGALVVHGRIGDRDDDRNKGKRPVQASRPNSSPGPQRNGPPQSGGMSRPQGGGPPGGGGPAMSRGGRDDDDRKPKSSSSKRDDDDKKKRR